MTSPPRTETRAPLRQGLAPNVTSPDGQPSRPPSFLVAAVASTLGLLAFLLVQLLLSAYSVSVARDAIDRGTLQVSPGYDVSLASHLPSLAAGGLAYVMLAVATAAIAGRGHRFLFMLPAAAFVFVSVLDGAPFAPQAVGQRWDIACYSRTDVCTGPWFSNGWLGALVDLALVSAPGWIVTRRMRPYRWPGRDDAATVAALGTCVAAIATVAWAQAVIHNRVDLQAVTVVGVVGLLLGIAKPWWPWFQVLIAAWASGFVGLVLHVITWPDPNFEVGRALPGILEEDWPIVAIALIGSAWQPLSWALRKLQESPMRLAIAVNALNVVDAAMTSLAIRSGGAYESNPFVEATGLPAKIALVALLSWILYRRKPSALIWPAAVLLWVACYHVAGVFVNGWR